MPEVVGGPEVFQGTIHDVDRAQLSLIKAYQRIFRAYQPN